MADGKNNQTLMGTPEELHQLAVALEMCIRDSWSRLKRKSPRRKKYACKKSLTRKKAG